MKAVETSGLRKVYGDVVAVENLTMSVDRGKIYGFLGPNGAGKTTVIRMLTGLVRPTAGIATVGGVPIAERDDVKDRIGLLPDEPPIYEELTPREQLEYWAGFHGLGSATATQRIDAVLTRFDLSKAADRRIESFSTGMRQKVGLAQAILHEPAVLFLDEPTSGLDPNTVHTVRTVLRDYVADDSTVFLSTHVLSVVEDVADEIGVLYDGELIAHGTPAQIKRDVTKSPDASLETAFRELTVERPRNDA